MEKMEDSSDNVPTKTGSLVSDALPSKPKAPPEVDLDHDVLQNLEKDLEHHEKLTLLFLILDDYLVFPKVYEAFYKNKGSNIFLQFTGDIENWQTKFLEALCITQSRKQIRKLGLSYDELKIIYDPSTLHTNPELLKTTVHIGAKLLWHLFDNILSENQGKDLLRMIYLDIDPPEGISEEDPLEMHAFYWLARGYITLSQNGYGDLGEIFKLLKPLGVSPCDTYYHDLEKYCKNSCGKILPIKTSDSAKMTIKHNVMEVEAEITKNHVPNGEVDNKPIKFIKSAYVLILNVITVPGTEYKDRKGSEADVKRLKETFEGLNYYVEVHDEPTRRELFRILMYLKNNFDRDKYDGLIVCILSHGIKDHFISHDNAEIPLADVEDFMCNDRLQKLPKIILVQACQGEKTGVPLVSKLAVDGPTTSRERVQVKNTIDYEQFFHFSSTMQDCRAIRHEVDGSWFIEAVCDVLQRNKCPKTRLSLTDWAEEVTHIVANKRGLLDTGIQASQLPQFNSRLTNKFYFPSFGAILGA